ncbi:Adhesion and hyphal regulator 1 [Yarrowia sp. E02]|nr:Adhesion and hyphal regulator 1 [Yarrowia sp. E02]
MADAARKFRRTRSGCHQCRRRKVKCDEAKPACGNCIRRREKCVYGVAIQFMEDELYQNAPNMSSGSESEPPPPVSHFINTLATDFVPQQRPRDELFASKEVSVNSPSQHLNRLLEVPLEVPHRNADHQAYFLHYFVYRFSAVFSPCSVARGTNGQVGTSPNLQNLPNLDPNLVAQTHSDTYAMPLQPEAILKLAAPGSALQYAIMAVAACMLARDEPHWIIEAIKYKSEALRLLQLELDRHHARTQPATPPHTVLLTMTLLCIYEIADGCAEIWTVHLIPAWRYINEVPYGSQDPALHMGIQFFAYQDVMGRTACGSKGLFDSSLWNRQSTKHNEWMGCSEQLTALIADAADLSREKRLSPDLDILVKFSKAQKLENEIGSIKGVDLGAVIESPGPLSPDMALNIVAGMKAVAAQIYLWCSLLRHGPEHDYIRGKVRLVLEAAKYVLGHGYHWTCLQWPLFVTAAQLSPFDDELESRNLGRGFILPAFEELDRHTLGNSARINEALIRIWKIRDMECESRLRDGESDWHKFVAPECHKLSLA